MTEPPFYKLICVKGKGSYVTGEQVVIQSTT